MEIWLWVVVFVLAAVVLKSCIKFVPQNRAYVIERFGSTVINAS